MLQGMQVSRVRELTEYVRQTRQNPMLVIVGLQAEGGGDGVEVGQGGVV